MEANASNTNILPTSTHADDRSRTSIVRSRAENIVVRDLVTNVAGDFTIYLEPHPLKNRASTLTVKYTLEGFTEEVESEFAGELALLLFALDEGEVSAFAFLNKVIVNYNPDSPLRLAAEAIEVFLDREFHENRTKAASRVDAQNLEVNL